MEDNKEGCPPYSQSHYKESDNLRDDGVGENRKYNNEWSKSGNEVKAIAHDTSDESMIQPGKDCLIISLKYNGNIFRAEISSTSKSWDVTTEPFNTLCKLSTSPHIKNGDTVRTTIMKCDTKITKKSRNYKYLKGSRTKDYISDKISPNTSNTNKLFLSDIVTHKWHQKNLFSVIPSNNDEPIDICSTAAYQKGQVWGRKILRIFMDTLASIKVICTRKERAYWTLAKHKAIIRNSWPCIDWLIGIEEQRNNMPALPPSICPSAVLSCINYPQWHPIASGTRCSEKSG